MRIVEEVTYEEFFNAVKEQAADALANQIRTEEKLLEFMHDEEDIIKGSYDSNLAEYKAGKITKQMFLTGGANGPAYSLYMLY